MSIFSRQGTVKHVFFSIVLLIVFQIFFRISENSSWSLFATVLLPLGLHGILYAGIKLLALLIDCYTDSIIVYGEVTNGNNNYMYHHLLLFIGDQMKSKSHKIPYCTQGDSRRRTRHSMYPSDFDFFDDQNQRNLLTAKYTPSFGYHTFNYCGKQILLQRKQRCDVSFNGSTGESIKLTTLKKNKDVLEKIVKEILPVPTKPQEGTTRILNWIGNNWQQNRQPVKQRKISSVILPAGSLENVVNDIKSYLGKSEWYSERGIPHRRGYLLYGPPGNGKSSCIRAIAGKLDCAICIISLNSAGLTDDLLDSAMNQAPRNSIILLEDIDAAFKSRKDESATSQETNMAFGGSGQSQVTFRGLLNALDGVGSMEGRIVFMTSNHADRLDDALIRPGRVDLKVLIDYPNEEQIRRMFNRFFPKENEEENYLEMENLLVSKIMNIPRPVSMSMIQGLFIIYTESPQHVIDNTDDYFKNLFSVSYAEPKNIATNVS